MQRRRRVFDRYQRFQFLRVMNCSIGYHVVADELRSFVSLVVILVAIEIHLVFLGPTSITAFLGKLVGLLFPGFRNLTLLDLPVLFARVALPGNLNETGVNDLSGFGKDTLIIERLVEAVKQSFDNPFLNQGFPELSDGLAIRHPVTGLEPDKALEAESVSNLVFHLVIREAVQSLKNEQLEHHHPIGPLGLCSDFQALSTQHREQERRCSSLYALRTSPEGLSVLSGAQAGNTRQKAKRIDVFYGRSENVMMTALKHGFTSFYQCNKRLLYNNL